MSNEQWHRLAFLSDRIFDISIPRDLRQPFYEEYISMKGKGTAFKFWLMEGEKQGIKPPNTHRKTLKLRKMHFQGLETRRFFRI
jgi:hypothetical protein